MIENYIQYASGYQKENIAEADVIKAIKNIQLMDDEHGVFGFQLLLMMKM